MASNLEKANVPKGIKTVIYQKKPEIEGHFKRILRGCKRIGLEGSAYYSFYLKMKKWLPRRKFVDVSEKLYQIRSIKSKNEVVKIQKAIRIAEASMQKVLSKTRPGLSEEKIEQMLKSEFLKHGADVNFCIVQVDSNSAGIHRRVSKRKLKNVLLLDIGPVYKGYASDITRTFFFGKNTKLQKEVYDAVLRAQKTAISKIKPGVKASEVYLAAKTSLGRWSKYFTHGLGHGIGLDYHEYPSLSEESKDVLKPGMVFTIEPGVYLPGKFGVRVEDDVLVTKKGYKLLSHFKK